jgi:hypothetical protein
VRRHEARERRAHLLQLGVQHFETLPIANRPKAVVEIERQRKDSHEVGSEKERGMLDACFERGPERYGFEMKAREEGREALWTGSGRHVNCHVLVFLRG